MAISRNMKKGMTLLLIGLVLLTIFSVIVWNIYNSSVVKQHIRSLGVSNRALGPRTISGRALADTWTNVHPFQNFDAFVGDVSAVAHTYDAVYGAELHNIATYRSINPNIYLTYYIPFHRDFGTFWDNTAIHDLAYWQSVHPDWVLYRCDRKTPALQYGDPNIPFDFTNPAVINWQVQTYAIPASQNGYDALAPDNIDFGNWYHACGIYRNGQWVQLFSGQPLDPKWRTAMLSWLMQMQNALHSLPHPIGLIPNLAFGGLSPMDPIIKRAVDLTDGVLDEGGFTFYGDNYVTNNTWVQHVQFNQYVQAENKPCYIVNDFHTINRFNIQWALASYLMGKDHSSEIYITGVQKYGVSAWWNEYYAQIGSPNGSMYPSQKVYWRNYTNGVSIVNPSSSGKYTVTLPSKVQYVDLYGDLISGRVTLLPHSGMVLVIRAQANRQGHSTIPR